MRTNVTALMLATVCATALNLVGRADDPPAPTRADYRNATNNLKQIGLALHNYESAYAYFPGDIEDKDGKPLLSWRVAILPFIEEDILYKQFKLDEPWDSENNKPLIAKMPKMYAPIRAQAKAGETFYQRFSGPGTPLVAGQKLKIASVTDGLSNTGLVFEAGAAVVWSKPADMAFDAKKALPKLGAHFDGECHVVMADGSVIRMKKDPDEKELRKLIQPADGEVIDIDKLKK